MNKVTTSNDKHGFCSKVFGPIWFFMHMVTLNYPPTPTKAQKETYKIWFLSMGKVLPCSICSANFPKNLKELNFNADEHLASRESFAEFVWKLHNHVNSQLGKNVYVTWEDFNKFYEQLRASDCSGDSCTAKTTPQCIMRFEPENTVPNDKLFQISGKCASNIYEDQHPFLICLTPIQR